MAVCPDYWPKARRDAPVHLQMALQVRPTRVNSMAIGPVVQVFRDDTGRVRVGQEIAFRVDCFDPGARAEPGPPVLGKQRFRVSLEWLKAARYLEVYLRPHQGGYEVVWDQVTPLVRRTRVPMNPVDSVGYGVLAPEEVRYPAAGVWERVRGWFR